MEIVNVSVGSIHSFPDLDPELGGLRRHVLLETEPPLECYRRLVDHKVLMQRVLLLDSSLDDIQNGSNMVECVVPLFSPRMIGG